MTWYCWLWWWYWDERWWSCVSGGDCDQCPVLRPETGWHWSDTDPCCDQDCLVYLQHKHSHLSNHVQQIKLYLMMQPGMQSPLPASLNCSCKIQLKLNCIYQIEFHDSSASRFNWVFTMWPIKNSFHSPSSWSIKWWYSSQWYSQLTSTLMQTFLTELNHQLETESTLEAAKTFDKIKLTFDATLNIKLKFRDWQKFVE